MANPVKSCHLRPLHVPSLPGPLCWRRPGDRDHPKMLCPIFGTGRKQMTGGFKDLLNFHPELWGFMIQFDERIFFSFFFGLFNHQLDDIQNLGGGLKLFLYCSPLFGEDVQFDEHIFQMTCSTTNQRIDYTNSCFSQNVFCWRAQNLPCSIGETFGESLDPKCPMKNEGFRPPQKMACNL